MNVQFQHILRPVFQCPLSPDHRTHKSRINPFLIRFPAIRVRHLHAQHTLFQLQRAHYRTWQIITQRDIVDINVRCVDNINIRRRVVLTNVSGLPYRQPSGYIRPRPFSKHASYPCESGSSKYPHSRPDYTINVR